LIVCEEGFLKPLLNRDKGDVLKPSGLTKNQEQDASWRELDKDIKAQGPLKKLLIYIPCIPFIPVKSIIVFLSWVCRSA
jgi:hypothetical protein